MPSGNRRSGTVSTPRVRVATWVVAVLTCGALLSAVWATSASATLTRPLLSSFGAFASVESIATDSAGNVYVYDGGAGTVYKFDAAGNPVNFAATGTNAISNVGSSSFSEGQIAVDSSAGPAKGDIYVAHASYENVLIYNAAGQQVGELTEAGGHPWGEACGVAVDSSGNVYVGLYPENVNKYTPAASPVTNSEYVSTMGGVTSVCNLAADSAGDVFVDTWESGPITRYEPSQFGSSSATGTVVDEAGSSLTVDTGDDSLFVDEGNQISTFGPKGEPFEKPTLVFAGSISGSEGVAVNGTSNDVYASDGKGGIGIFGPPAVLPTVSTGPASNVAAETATVSGEINPEGIQVQECFFEYGETSAYGQKTPCVEEPSAIGAGTSNVTVHADLSGLTAGTDYHYRLVAADEHGSASGEDQSFVYLIQKVESEYATAVSGSSATLNGTLNPHGTPTEYFFEYGTSASYGMLTATHQALGETVQSVEAHIGELLPETTYHYRLVTNSGRGLAAGKDLTFTTEGPGGPLQLLDSRQWELVSPPVKYGAGILKENGGGGSIVEASTSGDAITYVASNPIEEKPEGNGAPEDSQIISRRAADGTWRSRTLDIRNEEVHPLPIGHGLPFKMFNPSLTVGALEAYGYTPLAPNATEERAPYLRSEAACEEGASDCYVPTLTHEDTMPGAEWDKRLHGSILLETRFVDATEDLKHIVISSESPLTEGAVNEGLYEWTEGHLENVSINEAGESVPAQLGGSESDNVRGAISSNGTRLFWCERGCNSYNAGPLFMRDTVTHKSLRIVEGGDFQIANEDGSRVFYVGASGLSECTIVEGPGGLECEYSDVAPGVEGLVLGIDPSGSTVYFESSEALAEGAEAGGSNLYVSHYESGKWEPRLIAAVDPKHSFYEGDTSDWAGTNPYVQAMTARVSPNGRYLAFMSDRSLTGYDNRDALSGEPDEEVFLYDDQDHRLDCASCSPSGARPDGKRFGATETEALMDSHGTFDFRWIAADIPAWEASALNTGLHQPRYLSDEGRLFFNSATALVSQDANGVADVYEYEPDAVGNCAQSQGCVQLVSSGTSGEESTFLEASESGDNAFFITTARLKTQDTDTEYDVYDARICTESSPCAQAPVSPAPCGSGDSCKPAPTPQPSIFGDPASATFSGAGNLVAPPATVRARAKPSTLAHRLAEALKTCRKDKSRSKRGSCERQARKRYGPKTKARSHKATARKGGK